MVDRIDSSDKNHQAYAHDFNESVTLFSDALHEYHDASEFHKKEKLKDVMNKALQAMGESAAGLINETLQAKKAQLQNDYMNYTHHETAEGYQKLQQDIDTLKAEEE